MNYCFKLVIALSATAWLCLVPMSSMAAKIGMNDTGMTTCVDPATYTYTTVCANTGQDGETGRDVNKGSNKDGALGFSFQKVCGNGDLAGQGQCPKKPKFGTGAGQWACTKDLVTGLIWELKTDDGGQRDADNLYENIGDGASDDSSAYVTSVNAAGLCGASDWRMPAREELLSVVHFGTASPGPLVDTVWFPNTRGSLFWAADALVGTTQKWRVSFEDGNTNYTYASNNYRVRLVRSGK